MEQATCCSRGTGPDQTAGNESARDGRRLRVGDIMSPEVVTAGPDDTMLSVAKRISDHNVSCVVVVDNGQVAGILTEKDMLRGIAGNDRDFYRLRVAQRMSSPVQVIAPDCSILEAGRLMEAKGIRRLPVVENGRLVGIMTQTDITRGLISLSPLRYVSDIMTRNVATVDAEATVHEAAAVMAGRNISCVVALHRQEAVGILTEKDILKRIVALHKDPREVRVVDIMSFPLVAVRPTYSILSAGTKMEMMHLHRLVIMEGKQICGIVTQNDIMRTLRSACEARQSRGHAQAADSW